MMMTTTMISSCFVFFHVISLHNAKQREKNTDLFGSSFFSFFFFWTERTQ